MNGPEENKREQEMQFEVDDPRMKEFEQALGRAMQRVEVRAETAAKFLALAEEAERSRVKAGAAQAGESAARLLPTPRQARPRYSE